MHPKSKNRLALADLISLNGETVPIPCKRCSFLNLDCVIMSDYSKCSECTRLGRPCVGISLASLNRTHVKLESDLEAVVKERAEHSAAIARLDAKLSRLLRQLKHNKTVSVLKGRCVASELGDDNDGTEDEIPPDSNNPLESLSPSFWDSILSPPQNVEASSRSS